MPAGGRSSLRTRVAELAARWELDVGGPFPPMPGSPGNFVAPAVRADGTPCVLKVAHSLAETRTEIAALRLWKGRGAARLLACDPDEAAMLLERVAPGTMLAEVAARDDDAATYIAADLLRELWQPASVGDGLRTLESWCAAFDRNRASLLAGVAGFPRTLFERADVLRIELLSSTREPVALHGDLHHFNVLRSDRAGWLAIDPKGLLGDRCFDICQFLLNPVVVPPEVNTRRVDLFCSELGLDRNRTRDWCLVHAVLNACWAYEDGQPLAPTVTFAEQALRF
jgi:streptomycin 6-kinase